MFGITLNSKSISTILHCVEVFKKEYIKVYRYRWQSCMFRLCENDITSRQTMLMFIEQKPNSGEVTCR